MALVIDGKERECLVPFADMLNHELPDMTDWKFLPDRDGFTLTAKRDIEKGREVTTSYSEEYTTPEMFLGYGFVQPDFKFDMVLVNLSLSENDPLYKEKVTWLYGEGQEDQVVGHRVRGNLQDRATSDFVAFCRYIALNSADFTVLMDKRSALAGKFE